MSVHLLPSLGFQKGDDSCVVDSDCEGSLVCTSRELNGLFDRNATKQVIYKRHDDIQGSNNFETVERPSSDFFCSCDQSYGYTGFNCLEKSASTNFEITLYFFTIISTVIVIATGVKYGRLIVKFDGGFTAVSNSFILNGIASFLASLSAIVQIRDSLDPEKFVLNENNLKVVGSKAFVFLNTFSFTATFVTVLHIVYCWIQVTRNVQKMRHVKSQTNYDTLLKIILANEFILFFAILGLVAAGQNALTFIVGIPWVFLTIVSCIYGAWKMSTMLKQVSGAVKDYGSNPTKLTKKERKQNETNNHITVLLSSIQECAKWLVFFLFIGIIGAATIFLGSIAGIPFQFQSVEGNFNRIYLWGNMLVFNISFPCIHLVVTRYLYRLITSKLRRGHTGNSSSKDGTKNQGGSSFILSKTTNNQPFSNNATTETGKGGGRESNLINGGQTGGGLRSEEGENTNEERTYEMRSNGSFSEQEPTALNPVSEDAEQYPETEVLERPKSGWMRRLITSVSAGNANVERETNLRKSQQPSFVLSRSNNDIMIPPPTPSSPILSNNEFENQSEVQHQESDPVSQLHETAAVGEKNREEEQQKREVSSVKNHVPAAYVKRSSLTNPVNSAVVRLGSKKSMEPKVVKDIQQQQQQQQANTELFPTLTQTETKEEQEQEINSASSNSLKNKNESSNSGSSSFAKRASAKLFGSTTSPRGNSLTSATAASKSLNSRSNNHSNNNASSGNFTDPLTLRKKIEVKTLANPEGISRSVFQAVQSSKASMSEVDSSEEDNNEPFSTEKDDESSAVSPSSKQKKKKYVPKSINVGGGESCPNCSKPVGFADKTKFLGHTFHKDCLKCTVCKCKLSTTAEAMDHQGKPHCRACYSKLHGKKGLVGYDINV